MALKQVPVRLDPVAHEMLTRAAELDESASLAEFIRTAAIARAAWTIARHEPELLETWDVLYEAVGAAARDAVARAYPDGEPG